MKKKWLILTADTGFGHRSAANAIACAVHHLHPGGCEVKIINPALEPTTPYFFRKPQLDYDKFLQYTPDLYRFSYHLSNRQATSAIVDQTLSVCLCHTTYRLMNTYHPDAILSTFNFFLSPVKMILKTLRKNIPCFNVITDLTDVHRLWFQQKDVIYFVPTNQVQQQAIECGIPETNVMVSGVPVNPAISLERRSPTRLRTDLGWNPLLPTVLVVGSRRLHNIQEWIETLDACNRPLQIIVVAGGDEIAYRRLKDTRWHQTVEVYNYVDNIAQMMLAADILVSKAGGLIVSEALACGLPMILIDALPGQEAGNVSYVCRNQSGVRVDSPQEMLVILHNWLKYESLLSYYRQNARKTGRPDAAFQIAETIWQTVEPGKRSTDFNTQKLGGLRIPIS